MDEETLVIKETLLDMVTAGDLIAQCPTCNMLLSIEELASSNCEKDGDIDFDAILFMRRDTLPEA